MAGAEPATDPREHQLLGGRQHEGGEHEYRGTRAPRARARCAHWSRPCWPSASAWPGSWVGRMPLPTPASGPVDALNSLALDAQGAAAGDERALNSLETSLKSLKDAAAAAPEAELRQGRALSAHRRQCVRGAAGRGSSRMRLWPCAKRATSCRNCWRKSDRWPAVCLARVSIPRRALERFEVRSQRLQLDIAALGAGSSNPSAAAQRLADSSDYIGQVIKGFQGTDTSLGIPKATGPQAAQRLQTINQLYTDLGTAVRSAVNAAPAVPAAQNAAQTVTDDARGLAITAARTAPTSDGGLTALLPALLAAAVLLVVLAPVVRHPRSA